MGLSRKLVIFAVVLILSAVGLAQSKVECATIRSAILSQSVPYCVMLPPSYAQNPSRKFPVAYYLHGLGDNEQSLINLGGWNIYDRLMREKKIGEFVVIAPAGYASFYINSHDGKFRYEDFFFNEFMPAMEKKYRVGATRGQRGLLGISMGGFGALHYAFRYPQKFTVVSALMPALMEKLPQSFADPAQERILAATFGAPPDRAYYDRMSPFTLAERAPTAELKRLVIDMHCGSSDRYGFYEGTEQMHKLLSSRGVANQSHIEPGGHNWQFVADHFAEALETESRALGAM